jgi:hypothetical protein
VGNNFLVLQNEILMAIIHQFKIRSSQVSLSGRKNGISRGLPTMMVKNTVKKGDFSYIVAVSLIGGGKRNTQRKPQICH